jgi:hypothetical protein
MGTMGLRTCLTTKAAAATTTVRAPAPRPRRAARALSTLSASALGLALLALLAGCGGGEREAAKTQASAASATGTTAAPASTTTSKNAPATPPATVATVTSVSVPYAEYTHEYELALRTEPNAKQARQEAMRVLLYRNWIDQATSEANVSVSADEVHNSAEEQLKHLSESHTPGGAPEANGGESSSAAAQQQQAEQQYLQANGLTTADLETEARTQLLRSKLSANAAQAATAALTAKLPTQLSSIPSQQIEAYYNTHTQKLAQPNTRNIEIVRFQTAAQASKGLAELQRGESFHQVGHIDPELNRLDNYADRENSVTPPGYMQPNGISTGEDPTISKAAFGATTGTIVGPVKGSPPYVAYFILRVVSESPGAPKPLSAVRSEVASLVASQNQRTLSDATRHATEHFEKQFVSTWRAKTVCTAGYIMNYCSNGSS